MGYKEWRARFEALLEQSEEKIDLAEAALIIASDEYPQLNVASYLARLAEMADYIRPRLPSDQDPRGCVEVLNRYLFVELGFSGNQENYHDPRNSYLNEVIERRVGLPITLSLLYIALAARLGLPVYGVGLPGHFIVKWQDEKTQILIDPFDRGQILNEREVLARVRDTFHPQASFQPEWLAAVGNKYILFRLLNNLKAIFVEAQNYARAWKIVDKLLLLDPRSAENIRDMGLLSIHVGAYRQAAAFLEEYLLSHADAPDADQVRIYLRTALNVVERLN